MFSLNVLKKNTFFVYQIRRNFSMSQFSFKNKINLFLKHVHPDILGGDCPKHLKQENEKAIQELKQYIENVEHNNPNSSKKLEFNIAIENKINKNKILYKKIEIDLDETQPNNDKNLTTTHQMNIQYAIDNSIVKINMLKENKVKPEDIKSSYETMEKIEKEEKVEKKPKMLKTQKMMEDIHNFAMNRYYYSLIERAPYTFSKRKLMMTVNRMLYPRYPFKNMRKLDRNMRNIVKNLDSYQELDLLNKISFPPQLVFLDENLSQKQLQVAIENLKLKSSLKKNDDNIKLINELKEIVNIMVESDSLLRLFISREYSIEKMPGYITIPFNFDFYSFKSFFLKNREEALKIKKKFLEESKVENDIKKELLLLYSFNSFEILNTEKGKTKRNPLELMKENCLYLKQFKKFLFSHFKNQNYSNLKIYFCADENKEINNGNLTEVYIKIPLNEDELQKIFKSSIKVMI